MPALFKAELSLQISWVWDRGGLRRWGAPESKLQAPVACGWGQRGRARVCFAAAPSEVLSQARGLRREAACPPGSCSHLTKNRSE